MSPWPCAIYETHAHVCISCGRASTFNRCDVRPESPNCQCGNDTWMEPPPIDLTKGEQLESMPEKSAHEALELAASFAEEHKIFKQPNERGYNDHEESASVKTGVLLRIAYFLMYGIDPDGSVGE